jgi:heme exporter protein D
MLDPSHLDLDAGKYALFVWPAYGITVVVFAAMVWAVLAHARRWKRRCQVLSSQELSGK